MSRARLVIVEDEIIVALDLKTRLQLLGYEVVGVFNAGEDGLNGVEELKPDLILMDIGLGGRIDGIQAAETIRERFQIPVIYVTASTDEKTLERAKVTEPFGYLLKPFEDQELHSHIEIALYKHQTEKKLRESEERYSLATEGANDGLWDWNLDENSIYLSPRWEAMLGYAAGELQQSPRDWFLKVHPSDRRRLRREIAEFLRSDDGHFQSEYRIIHRDGNYRWMLTRGIGLRNAEGRVYRMAGAQTDVTDRKLQDPLTGLPNRALFIDRLERVLQRARRNPDGLFAVLVIKSESFARVRESLGLSVSDLLLIQFVERLRRCLHEDDTVVSLGGDGFAVLLEDIKQTANVVRVANRLEDDLKRSFRIDDQEIYTSISMGIALSSPSYRRAEDLLRDAHTALFRARERGEGPRFEIFDAAMRSRSLARLRMESQLRRAIEREEFAVFYQPIVSLRTGKLEGFEALVRWQPPDRAVILPHEFIPIAEETGLIIPLERWVLREACAQLRKWQELASNPQLSLSVNFSAAQYHQTDLIGELKKTLIDTGIDPNTLKLEITETAFLRDTEALKELLFEIEKLEVQLHLDDFGTGYSSLSYLHKFPISVLKIDRSFINDLALNPRTKQIVDAIAHLGQNLQMEVTAEGIESLEQLHHLQFLDCDYGQGYLFSKPADAGTAGQLVLGVDSWQAAFKSEETSRILRARNSRRRNFPDTADPRTVGTRVGAGERAAQWLLQSPEP